MGSASSKATKKLPKRAPSWAGARTPSASEPYPTSRPPMASETKSQAVLQDAADPHLAENLNKLGAVRVDHHMRAVRTDQTYRKVYEARTRSEFDAAEAKNQLLAINLSDLLAKRQLATSEAQIRDLAKEYGIEYEALEKLSTFVTAPNAGEGTMDKTVNEEGEEVVTTRAVWIDPIFDKPRIS